MPISLNTTGVGFTAPTQATGPAQQAQGPTAGSLDGHSIQSADNHRAPEQKTTIGDKVLSFFKSIQDSFKSLGTYLTAPLAARAEAKLDRLADKTMNTGESDTVRGKALNELFIKSEAKFPGHGAEHTAGKIASSLERMPIEVRNEAIDSLRNFNAGGALFSNLMQGQADYHNAVRTNLAAVGLTEEQPQISADDLTGGDFHTNLTQFGQAIDAELDRVDAPRMARRDAITNSKESLLNGTASDELKQLFKAHAATKFNVDAVNLLFAIQEFKQDFSTMTPEEADTKYAYISKEFLEPNSPQTGNISYKLATEAVKTEGRLPTANIFDKILSEVVIVIGNNEFDNSAFLKNSKVLDPFIATGAIADLSDT